MDSQTVQNLKADGKYREAGAASFAVYGDNPRNGGCDYGCHYGMRSSREWAICEFKEGFDHAAYEARQAAKKQA